MNVSAKTRSGFEAFERILALRRLHAAMTEAEFDRHIDAVHERVRTEILANSQTEQSERRRAAFWGKACRINPDTGGYVEPNLAQSIWQDGLAAFDEGAGEDSCPFYYGSSRQLWLEAYHAQERDSA